MDVQVLQQGTAVYNDECNKGELRAVYDRKRVYCFVKRLFDVIISMISIIVLSPVFLIVAFVIKLEDGEVFFTYRIDQD